MTPCARRFGGYAVDPKQCERTGGEHILVWPRSSGGQERAASLRACLGRSWGTTCNRRSHAIVVSGLIVTLGGRRAPPTVIVTERWSAGTPGGFASSSSLGRAPMPAPQTCLDFLRRGNDRRSVARAADRDGEPLGLNVRTAAGPNGPPGTYCLGLHRFGSLLPFRLVSPPVAAFMGLLPVAHCAPWPDQVPMRSWAARTLDAWKPFPRSTSAHLLMGSTLLAPVLVRVGSRLTLQLGPVEVHTVVSKNVSSRSSADGRWRPSGPGRVGRVATGAHPRRP